MRIGFFLQRSTELKVLGGLIDAALQESQDVAVFYQTEASQGTKRYQNLQAGDLEPFSGAELYPRAAVDDLLAEMRAWQPDYLLTLEGYHSLYHDRHLAEFLQLREAGIQLVSLSHFYEIANRPLEALEDFDLTLYVSEFGRDLHFDLLGNGSSPEALAQRYAEKYAVAGSPMFDQIGRVGKAEARAALGLPMDQPVILFISPVLLSTTPWRHTVWRDSSKLSRSKDALRLGRWGFLPEIWTGQTFRQTVAAIRNFADRNQALVLLKSRGKHKDPDYLVEAADLYLDGHEDDFYPVFTTYQCLAAADLCISVNSMSVLESVASGTPTINIYVPHQDRVQDPGEIRRRYYDRIFAPAAAGPFDYPGCVTQIDRRRFPTWLRDKSLDDFSMDEDRQQAYVNDYLGIDEQSSSSRILGLLHERRADS